MTLQAPRMAQPEDQARENIDWMLTKSGWAVRDQDDAHISAYRELAIRTFTLVRKEVPKTFIFAKDYSYAEYIVQIVREEFGKENDFAQKITCSTTGKKPEALTATRESNL